jgi:hypothetical protein
MRASNNRQKVFKDDAALSESALKEELKSAGAEEYAPEVISDDHDSQCDSVEGSTPKPKCRKRRRMF